MTATENLVSIIVPTYNEPKSVLESLKQLPELPAVHEVVVVDASDDERCKNVLSELNNVPNLRLIRTETKGRGVQMNIGAAAVTTPVLLFLHADTHLDKEAARATITALNAGYYWGRFDTKLDDDRWQFRMIAWCMNKRSALTHIATGDQAIFMTHEAFDIVGGFDDIELMEDIAMSTKLKRIGPICAVPMAVETSARRWQQLGISKTILQMWWLRFRYFVGAPPAELVKSYAQIRAKVKRSVDNFPVYLFAKAPVAGKVKSRLCPPLNDHQAALVAVELLNLVASELAEHWPGHVVLAMTPNAAHPRFQNLLRQHKFSSLQQRGADLGERMLHALRHGLNKSQSAAVIGADIPAISGQVLTQAYQSLLQDECVVGPTHDGGFYYLGVNKAPIALFKDIVWGGPEVFEQLMINAKQLEMDFIVLPLLHDCDYWGDVQAAAQQVPLFGSALTVAGVNVDQS